MVHAVPPPRTIQASSGLPAGDPCSPHFLAYVLSPWMRLMDTTSDWRSTLVSGRNGVVLTGKVVALSILAFSSNMAGLLCLRAALQASCFATWLQLSALCPDAWRPASDFCCLWCSQRSPGLLPCCLKLLTLLYAPFSVRAIPEFGPTMSRCTLSMQLPLIALMQLQPVLLRPARYWLLLSSIMLLC